MLRRSELSVRPELVQHAIICMTTRYRMQPGALPGNRGCLVPVQLQGLLEQLHRFRDDMARSLRTACLDQLIAYKQFRNLHVH